MTQQEGRYQYKGYVDCFSTILRREGPRALFLGLRLRVIWVGLGGFLCLGGYDAFKALFRPLVSCTSSYTTEATTEVVQDGGEKRKHTGETERGGRLAEQRTPRLGESGAEPRV
ncbi:mitochondrial carrier superfamily protein [Cystoisospora suis]|uniref:Mitochondrial carrier superfamily protein n=1 Tax=Cystoisospora suis TaxID=483139 RepID=A0A2C6L842_9APIC|nr:mitochondrial carrier superfamily protein [Cystoisospora suis]